MAAARVALKAGEKAGMMAGESVASTAVWWVVSMEV